MDIKDHFKEGCMKIREESIPFPGTHNDFLSWIGLSKTAFEKYRFDQLEKTKRVKEMGFRFIGARRYLNQVVFTIRTDRNKKIAGLRTDKDENFTGRPMDNYNDACRATLILIWEMITRRLS